jgi:hypothetical protein
VKAFFHRATAVLGMAFEAVAHVWLLVLGAGIAIAGIACAFLVHPLAAFAVFFPLIGIAGDEQ